MKQIFAFLLASGSFCFAQEHHGMPNGPRPTPTPRPPPSPFVEPKFLLPANPDVNDYRPVVNAEGTKVVFERYPTGNASDVKLYILDLATGDVQPFVTFASTRPDWCWIRSGGTLTSGPVAFSNDHDGIYRVDPGGQPVLLSNTAGMIYPAWYPGCQYLAVDVGAQADLGQGCNEPARPLTAKIDATTGAVVVCRLANDTVWAGFPSVNQVNPNLVAFAGQFNGESNYYDQELNYSWVTDTSTQPPHVAPFDHDAPTGPAFLQKFQARTGWWSPDGKWFAFESNRICNDLSGQTYAIFIQDASGTQPAIQVSDCKWNVQHPKWFPPRNDGKTLLIAPVQPVPRPGQSPQPYRLATFDVSRLVIGTGP
jgi:WD40-like Beta Propeller Repeat